MLSEKLFAVDETAHRQRADVINAHEGGAKSPREG
jgi:hypothetical protein